ncbi:hypothetical protein [Lewinella sp. IMCC34183]|uniref:hypothetical protein n=1 Tax=Lewinella sp. IMCC34183 TaxID=2248762 RepID=UPI000E27F154|nr:hypothetical protein [Lewinella sp. IMCC34183]
MRSAACLFCLLFLSPLTAQHLEAEDTELRRRVAAGALTPDDYARRSADLRAAVKQAGGYPTMPVDSLGRYRLTRLLTFNGNFEAIRRPVERWLALGGFGGGEQYAWTSDSSFVRYLVTPYQFTGQHRRLLAGLWSSGDPVSVGCVLEVRVGGGGLELILSDPVLTEQYVATYHPGFGYDLQYFVREGRHQMGDFLPVVDGTPKQYAARLQRAAVIDSCLKGLADSLQAFLE